MKIVSAEVFVTCPGRNFVTLKITTDCGLTGLGDATLNGRELSVASYLKDHLDDYLFRLLLNYDVSLKMLEEFCPSLLKNPNYETLIKTYINEKD